MTDLLRNHDEAMRSAIECWSSGESSRLLQILEPWIAAYIRRYRKLLRKSSSQLLNADVLAHDVAKIMLPRLEAKLRVLQPREEADIEAILDWLRNELFFKPSAVTSTTLEIDTGQYAYVIPSQVDLHRAYNEALLDDDPVTVSRFLTLLRDWALYRVAYPRLRYDLHAAEEIVTRVWTTMVKRLLGKSGRAPTASWMRVERLLVEIRARLLGFRKKDGKRVPGAIEKAVADAVAERASRYHLHADHCPDSSRPARLVDEISGPDLEPDQIVSRYELDGQYEHLLRLTRGLEPGPDKDGLLGLLAFVKIEHQANGGTPVTVLERHKIRQWNAELLAFLRSKLHAKYAGALKTRLSHILPILLQFGLVEPAGPAADIRDRLHCCRQALHSGRLGRNRAMRQTVEFVCEFLVKKLCLDEISRGPQQNPPRLECVKIVENVQFSREAKKYLRSTLRLRNGKVQELLTAIIPILTQWGCLPKPGRT